MFKNLICSFPSNPFSGFISGEKWLQNPHANLPTFPEPAGGSWFSDIAKYFKPVPDAPLRNFPIPHTQPTITSQPVVPVASFQQPPTQPIPLSQPAITSQPIIPTQANISPFSGNIDMWQTFSNLQNPSSNMLNQGDIRQILISLFLNLLSQNRNNAMARIV